VAAKRAKEDLEAARDGKVVLRQLRETMRQLESPGPGLVNTREFVKANGSLKLSFPAEQQNDAGEYHVVLLQAINAGMGKEQVRCTSPRAVRGSDPRCRVRRRPD